MFLKVSLKGALIRWSWRKKRRPEPQTPQRGMLIQKILARGSTKNACHKEHAGRQQNAHLSTKGFRERDVDARDDRLRDEKTGAAPKCGFTARVQGHRNDRKDRGDDNAINGRDEGEKAQGDHRSPESFGSAAQSVIKQFGGQLADGGNALLKMRATGQLIDVTMFAVIAALEFVWFGISEELRAVRVRPSSVGWPWLFGDIHSKTKKSGRSAVSIADQ